MTKYILHGGYARVVNPENDRFFKAILEGLTGKIKVLLVYFARVDEDVNSLAEGDKVRFKQNNPDKDLEFEIATPKRFSQQVKKAQVVYIRGGSMKPLKEKLAFTSNFRTLFEGKVVAGSSAGCYILSKCYWNNDLKQVEEGLGLISFNAFCHYKPSYEELVKILPFFQDKTPLLVLPDYKWQIVFA